jgi:glycosyltransferase involved in cell wall biosynthesis
VDAGGSQRVRIGVVVDKFAYGGLETHLIDFASHAQPDHELHLILGMQADTRRAGTLVGGRVLQVEMSPAQPAAAVVRGVELMTEYCLKAGLDLLHLHPFFSLHMGALAAALAGLPFIVTLHGPHSIRQSMIDGALYAELLQDLVLGQAAHVLCVSEEVADEARALQPRARIHLLRNPVDLSLVRPASASAGGDWALVGRLDHDKVPGMMHFIDLMSLARPLGRIRVFGRGESEELLKDWVERGGHCHTVSWEGFKADLPAQLTHGFAGVAGMGRVLLEAAALNLPFILVGYDGTKGLVSLGELEGLAARNYSGRGLHTIGADRLAQHLAALEEDRSAYMLRDWVREHADSNHVWGQYRDLLTDLDRPARRSTDWLLRLGEHPEADLASSLWTHGEGPDRLQRASRYVTGGANAEPDPMSAEQVYPSLRRDRRERQRALAVKWVKPIVPNRIWRVAKTALVEGSRCIGTLRGKRGLKTILSKHFDARGFVIYPPSVDWRLPLFQRPHQLALSFAEKGFVFFFCTGNTRYDDVSGFVEVAPRVYVTDQYRALRLVSEPILLISLPSNIRYIDMYNPKYTIYDYIDELEIFRNYGPEMVEQHWELIRRADLVTVTAEKLLNDVTVIRTESVVLSPNAVDYQHFAAGRHVAGANDIAGLLDPERPVIGYYGALAEWFDYELVKYSTLRTGFQYLLIGLDYDGTVTKAGLDLCPDIHFIGPRDYQALPSYASVFDVATIPFCANRITEATSPLKLYEYMAAGRPIVTTDMRECRRYRSVLIGRSREEFVEQLYRALELRRDAGYLAVLEREAKENTWSARVDQMLQCLNLQ